MRHDDRGFPDAGKPPKTGRWKLVGSGIVAAAIGVGAGDLVASLIAASRFGYALLWTAVLGCIVKIALAEGSARYHLATGSAMLERWKSLGRWTSWYLGIYIMIWGFVYCATAMSATALPLAALFPSVLLWLWAILSGSVCAIFVALNRYEMFENAMKFFIGVMFFVVVGVAMMVVPNVGAALTGLIPSIPEGSVVYTLGLIGGVGGTIVMASYGYWCNAKGWRTPAWMGIGAEMLYTAQIALSTGDRGVLDLDEVLRERIGPVVSAVFLIGFFATAISSIIGVWHGVSMLFADFVRVHIKGETGSREGLEDTGLQVLPVLAHYSADGVALVRPAVHAGHHLWSARGLLHAVLGVDADLVVELLAGSEGMAQRLGIERSARPVGSPFYGALRQ